MATFLTVTTDQLRIGDVVHNHGMRILLDRPPIIWPRDESRTRLVYSWPGLVLNPEEAIAEHRVPRGWLYDSRGDYDHDQRTWTGPRPSTRPGWSVQGNDWADWYISREHDIGC